MYSYYVPVVAASKSCLTTVGELYV